VYHKVKKTVRALPVITIKQIFKQ